MTLRTVVNSDGTKELILEQQIQETTQPEAVTSLISEQEKFIVPGSQGSQRSLCCQASLSEISPLPGANQTGILVKHPETFTGNEISYFIVRSKIESQRNVWNRLRSYETTLDVEKLSPDSLVHFGYTCSKNSIDLTLVRKLGFDPLAWLPDPGRDSKNLASMLEKPSLVLVAENDLTKAIVCVFVGLSDFVVHGSALYNNFDTVLETVQCKCDEFLPWELMTESLATSSL